MENRGLEKSPHLCRDFFFTLFTILLRHSCIYNRLLQFHPMRQNPGPSGYRSVLDGFRLLLAECQPSLFLRTSYKYSHQWNADPIVVYYQILHRTHILLYIHTLADPDSPLLSCIPARCVQSQHDERFL